MHCSAMASTESVLADVAETETNIEQLFAHFDHDNNGVLGFTEVAALFKQLAPEQSAQSAANAAVEALLMSDANADRKLDKAEFEQLLIKISTISGVPLLETTSKLLALAQQQPAATAAAAVQDVMPVAQEAPASTIAAAAATTATDTSVPNMHARHEEAANSTAMAADHAGPATAVQGASQTDDHSRKLLALFEHWDKSGNGRIRFSELCQGLAKFKRVRCKEDVLSLLRESASVLAAHDSNADWQLDLAEFSAFLSSYMAAAGYKLDNVLDELLSIASTKPDSKALQQVLEQAQPVFDQVLSDSVRREGSTAATGVAV